MNVKGKKINFLGDSITEGHGTSGAEHIYWNVLAQNTGAIVRGYGIGGTRIARQQHPMEPPAREDRYFRLRVDEMDPDADMVVVFGGTNDWGHGDAPLGDFDNRSDDTFYGAVHNLCLALVEKYPTATIVFMTPLHRYRVIDEPYVNNRGLRRAGTMADYRCAIREVAGYYGLPVLELEKVTGMQPAVDHIAKRYMPDGLHPNDAGHQIIAARLQGFLESL